MSYKFTVHLQPEQNENKPTRNYKISFKLRCVHSIC